jgi:hypothetical protein
LALFEDAINTNSDCVAFFNGVNAAADADDASLCPDVNGGLSCAPTLTAFYTQQNSLFGCTTADVDYPCDYDYYDVAYYVYSNTEITICEEALGGFIVGQASALE